MDIAVINGLLVRTAGPPAGQRIVLIHAFGDDGSAFEPLFGTSLAACSRLVAVDLAGFGASPGRPDIRTMAEHAGTIAALVGSLPGSGPVGLVAHSVVSMIAVAAAPRLGKNFAGLFAIEGNLTADDAYFSGRAAAFDDPHRFKQRYLDDIWTMAQAQPGLRRYFAAAVAADPVALWQMGRDARRLSVGDGPGQAYRRIRPSRYYWSNDNTVEATRRWIIGSDIDHSQFTDASHWPMVDRPDATARAIAAFFDSRHAADRPE